nr:MAG TPA: hypothetical protein [Caudoviricetes sp.]
MTSERQTRERFLQLSTLFYSICKCCVNCTWLQSKQNPR